VGLPCFLEGSPEGLGLYRASGFEVVGWIWVDLKKYQNTGEQTGQGDQKQERVEGVGEGWYSHAVMVRQYRSEKGTSWSGWHLTTTKINGRFPERRISRLQAPWVPVSRIFVSPSTSPSPTPRWRPNHTNAKQRKIPISRCKPSRSPSLTAPAKPSVDLALGQSNTNSDIRTRRRRPTASSWLRAGNLVDRDSGSISLFAVIDI